MVHLLDRMDHCGLTNNAGAIDPIISPSPCLGKARDTIARVFSGTIYNGCGTLSFDYKQAYTTAVNLDVYVNNIKVCNVISPGGSGDTSNVHNSGPVSVNLSGDFSFEFIQADSTGSGQVTIDNLEWSCDTAFPNHQIIPQISQLFPDILRCL